MTLKTTIQDDIKSAMKSKETEKLATLRLLSAALKQKEVDERIELDDAQVVAIIDKMIKQRKESIQQFTNGNRPDLAEKEQSEIDILQIYMPQGLSEDEIKILVDQAVAEVGATSVRDMGKVMNVLRSQTAGRADMTVVSNLVKAKFN